MKIVFASAECAPYAKTGGLGDVVGSLPKALRLLGHEVSIIIPNYSHINHERFHIHYQHEIGEIPVRVNGKTLAIHVHMAHLPGSDIEVYFIDYPPYYHRGSIYSNAADEDERFILLNKSVLELIQRMKWNVDIIHCNDWQTGLIPLYVKDNYSWDRLFDKTATVMTIHNIAYQGRFSKDSLSKAEIRSDLYYPNSPVEVYGGQVCFLKAGLIYSDAVNTVSPTYAAETITSQYGEGLDGVLAYRINDYYGIINGVDYTIWNPGSDPYLPYHYDQFALEQKYQNKLELLARVGLPLLDNAPLIGIVSRLVDQKGFNILIEAMPELLRHNAQWVILGSGEKRYEDYFRELASIAPEKVASHIGYNEDLAHLIEAGSDIFMMPSRFEPCGLNQIYSLKYGTVPIVRKTGGLADTVQDWDELKHYGNEDGTGFSFHDYSATAIIKTFERAIGAFHNKEVWYKIQCNGMQKDYSWEVSAMQYVDLYKKGLKNRRGG